jgi:hypothetical protein
MNGSVVTSVERQAAADAFRTYDTFCKCGFRARCFDPPPQHGVRCQVGCVFSVCFLSSAGLTVKWGALFCGCFFSTQLTVRWGAALTGAGGGRARKFAHSVRLSTLTEALGSARPFPVIQSTSW